MDPDIHLEYLTSEAVRVIPESLHAILWLQLNMDEDCWDALTIGGVSLEKMEAVRMSQQAEAAGLRVYFPGPSWEE